MKKLICIKDNIEKMSKKHQIDILRLLNDSVDVILNENSNGIFVNLSELDITILEKLETFINYVNKQQETTE